MRQLLVIAHVMGGLLMVFSGTFLLPLGWSLAVGDGTHRSFLVSAASTLGAGLVLFGATRRFGRELQSRDGPLLVVLGWITMALSASVPLMLEIRGLTFTDAFFETISALTTTGATVLTGLDTLPQSINVWRHALQWFGGMGIIVLAVAILPLLGVGGMQLYRAETPGPMKESKMTPRITQTAKYLWLIYAGLTAACVGALRVAGMDWYEAVCHGFSALALGGFSTRDASVGAFDSVAIEAVLAAFMLIAVLNFTTHFLALRKRSARVYLMDAEASAVLALIGSSALMLAAFLTWQGVYDDGWTALRHAAFSAVSIGTSTGYVGVDYGQWPVFAPMWMLLMATIGSSAGSTGGGIKMMRVLILARQAANELKRMIHPRAVTPLCIKGHVVENKVILAVLGYMLLYGFTVVSLSFLLMASGLDFVTAFSGVVASVNNLGPAMNFLGPAHNFQVLTDFQTWVCAFAMLAGRLELLTLFVLLAPAFWRK
jgi:trk system potassium uptake protein TrkH